jgi:filamentous hemagglutinin
LNYLDNFQGLPKTFNSSKGGKLPVNWLKYKGQALHPDYLQRNKDIQRQLLKDLNDLINSILGNKGG